MTHWRPLSGNISPDTIDKVLNDIAEMAQDVEVPECPEEIAEHNKALGDWM